MGEPITWRTVVGNGLENAWRPMAGAVQTLDSGFDRLMKMIEGRQEVNQGIEDRGQEAQVLKFKEALANARTPEEIAALQGQRDTYLAGLKPKFLGETIGAEDQRRAALYEQLPKQLAYEHSKLDEAQQGRVQEFQSLLARDPAAAQFWLSQNKDLRTYGDLAMKAHAEAQANTKAESERQRTAAEIKHWADQTRIGERQVGVQEGTYQLSRFDKAIQEEQRVREQLAKNGAGTVGGQGGMDSLTAELAKTVDKDKLGTVTRFLSEALSRNPAFRDLPTDVVYAIAKKHSADIGTGNWVPDFNVASRMEADLAAQLGAKPVQDRISANTAQRTQLLEQLKLYTPMLDEARRGVFPNVQAQIDAAAARANGTAPAAPGGVDLGRLTQVVMGAESGGRRYDASGKLLESPKGAKGEMQVVDKTNGNPGFGVVPAKDNSPDERARVGRDYLAAMVREFGGDISKAAAAYNYGPGAVRAAIDNYGDVWLSKMPKETKDYVAKVTQGYGDAGDGPVNESGDRDPGPSGAKFNSKGKVISPLPEGLRYADLKPAERAEFDPDFLARKLAEERGQKPSASAPTASAKPDSLLARQAAVEQQEIAADLRKTFSTEVRDYLKRQGQEDATKSAAQASELRKRAEVIQQRQQEDYRRRLGQLSQGQTGSTVGPIALAQTAQVAAAREARAKLEKELASYGK